MPRITILLNLVCSEADQFTFQESCSLTNSSSYIFSQILKTCANVILKRVSGSHCKSAQAAPQMTFVLYVNGVALQPCTRLQPTYVLHFQVRCIVSPVWWITTTFIYYGMSINAVNMSGNRYLNYVAVSAVEIPGYWAAVVLMARVGRKPVLICAFWVCSACQIGYIFIPSGKIHVNVN